MANPTSLTQPKPVAFSITLSSAAGPIPFQVWNTTTGEVIRKDNAGNLLITSLTGKGAFDASWFSSGYSVGDKLIVSWSGKTYGSGNVTLTSAESGSQKITAVSEVTTALPGVSL